MPLKNTKVQFKKTPLENADIDKSSDRTKGGTKDNILRNNVS